MMEEVNKKLNRYLEKIKLVGGKDPYELPENLFKDISCFKCTSLPDITYPDIYNYLINSPSPYTGESLKAFKSLEAYKFFTAGHVRNIKLALVEGCNFIVKAQVIHSQRINEKPLNPWICVQKDGIIICTHCDCMAGLGESCSHVTALMFAIETGIKMMKSRSCTSMPCSWLEGSNRKVSFNASFEIDFSSAKTKHANTLSETPKKYLKRKCVKEIKSTTPMEEQKFYSSLSKSGIQCSILSIMPGHASNFFPSDVISKLPVPLSELYSVNNLKLSFDEVREKSDLVFESDLLCVTQAQANRIEQETLGQVKNKLWFTYRTGRITASKFKSASVSNPTHPSHTLINQICYPEAFQSSTESTRWGCSNEEHVREQYNSLQKYRHTDFKLEECGVFISPFYCWLGASPDGMIDCSCCGKGTLEIKCPYTKRHDEILQTTCDPAFCLNFDKTTQMMALKRNHAYYFQVQAQIVLTNSDYCDFVVWTAAKANNLFIERITKDDTFSSNVGKAETFYRHCILPELLSKWFTRHPQKQNVNIKIDSMEAVCHCCRPVCNEALVECASDGCSIGKYHLRCLKLKRIPNKKWTCPDCREILKHAKQSESADK